MKWKNRSQLQEIKKQMERRKIENNNIRIEYLRKESNRKKQREGKKEKEEYQENEEEGRNQSHYKDVKRDCGGK